MFFVSEGKVAQSNVDMKVEGAKQGTETESAIMEHSGNCDNGNSDRKSSLDGVKVRQSKDGAITVEQTNKTDDGKETILTTVKQKRTESESTVFEKDTVVTTEGKTDSGEEYYEKDEIITTRKLTSQGSIYMDTEVLVSKKIHGKMGSEFIEEDVIHEKDVTSATTGVHFHDESHAQIIIEKQGHDENGNNETRDQENNLSENRSHLQNNVSEDVKNKTQTGLDVSKVSSGYGSYSGTSEEEEKVDADAEDVFESRPGKLDGNRF